MKKQNVTFYDLLGVGPDADTQGIKEAYRKISKIYDGHRYHKTKTKVLWFPPTCGWFYRDALWRRR